MKRLTETLKWNDPWFRKLSAPAKLLFIYACDQCDCAGTVHLDFELVSQDLRLKVDEKHVAEIGADRLTPVGESRYYLTKFIPFQYGELSEKCLPHRKVIAEIERKGIARVGIGYAYTSCTHKNGKEEDRKKNGKEEGGPGETKPAPVDEPLIAEFPVHLRTARVLNRWEIWQTHRRGFKKPASWSVLFNEQVQWLSKYDEATVFEILSASIRNGWQGLFEPQRGRGQVASAVGAARGPGGNF